MSTTTTREAHAHNLKRNMALAAHHGPDGCDVPNTERCKYPSKLCVNPRAAKSSGKLHRLCEFHRRRANGNQRRWTSVRRSHTRHEREAAMMMCYYGMPVPLCASRTASVSHSQSYFLTPSSLQPPRANLSICDDRRRALDQEEIAILTTLLSANDYNDKLPHGESWSSQETSLPHYQWPACGSDMAAAYSI